MSDQAVTPFDPHPRDWTIERPHHDNCSGWSLCHVGDAWDATTDAVGRAGEWLGERNWGDLASGIANGVWGVKKVVTGYVAWGLVPLGCGEVCGAYAAYQIGTGLARINRARVQIARGFEECTAYCSTRNQLIHFGLNLAPTPIGPYLRCRSGGCGEEFEP
jgi:hypothetical protein